MPIIKSWKLFQAGNPIDYSGVLDLMTLLSKTSDTLADEMGHVPPNVLMDKINSIALGDPGTYPLPHGPYGGGKYNWMKATIGYDPAGKPIVAVLYHLLRHRIAAGKDGYWSVSVGFEQSLVGDPPLGMDGTEPDHPYVRIIEEITAQIGNDLELMPPLSMDAQGYPYCVIYDRVDPDEDPDQPPGNNETKRRSKKIGEMGWVFERNATANPNLKIISQTKEPTPIDSLGDPILSWGDEIVVTLLSSQQ